MTLIVSTNAALYRVQLCTIEQEIVGHPEQMVAIGLKLVHDTLIITGMCPVMCSCYDDKDSCYDDNDFR